MKVLLVSSEFPPPGGAAQRSLTLARYLPGLGIETHVLAPIEPTRASGSGETRPATQAWVHRVRNLGSSERVPWNLTAIPAAIRLVRRHEIGAVITTSPPSSIHLVGAAVARATRARWIPDLRETPPRHLGSGSETTSEWVKERAEAGIARLAARFADAIVCADDGVAEAVGRFEPRGCIVTIASGGSSDAAASGDDSAFAGRTADLLRSLS